MILIIVLIFVFSDSIISVEGFVFQISSHVKTSSSSTPSGCSSITSLCLASTDVEKEQTPKNSKKKSVNNHNNNNNRKRYQNQQYRKGGGGKNQKALMKAKALNKEIIECTSPSEVLQIFLSSGAARNTAGNGEMNSVNFSTSLHRLAKTCSMGILQRPNNYNKNNNMNHRQNQQSNAKKFRTMTLTDPRFAILLCAVSEAFVEKKSMFNCRELSNISWALAKINFVPDKTSIPLSLTSNDIFKEDGVAEPDTVTIESMDNMLLMSAKRLRESVLLAGKHKKTTGEASQYDKLWISQMRILGAHLLDAIAAHTQHNLLSKFKSQELANMLWSFATVGRTRISLFNDLVLRLMENQTTQQSNNNNNRKQKNDYDSYKCKPQEISNSIWSFAKAGIRGEGQVKLFHFVAETFEEDPNYIQLFKPQELSNTAWGIATLLSKRAQFESTNNNSGSVSSSSMTEEEAAVEDMSAFKIIRQIALELVERIDQFKPQEVSNTVWALATVEFGIRQETSSEEDLALLNEVFHKAAVNALPRLRRFSPQELNCLGWAFAKLGAEKGNPEVDLLFQGIGDEVKRRYTYFSPQDVGTTLWSFATMGYTEFKDVYNVAASRVSLKDAPSFKPQELSNSIWALATSGIVPPNTHVFDTTLYGAKTANEMLKKAVTMDQSDTVTECFMAVAMELMKRPFAFKEQELKDVLWSFSKAGVRHPLLFKKVAEHVVGESATSTPHRGLLDFTPQGIGNLAYSYARQAQLSKEQQQEEQANPSYSSSNGRLAVYETICIDMGEDLVNRLFATVADCSLRNGLNAFKPQDLSNTAWSFATLGLLHEEFFSAITDQVVNRIAAQLPRKSQSLLPASSKNLKRNPSLNPEVFKPQEIANLAWAFATVNYGSSSDILYYIGPYVIEKVSPCAVTYKGSPKEFDEVCISKRFNRQELANIAWSCAVLGQYPEGLMQFLYSGLMGSGKNRGDHIYMENLYQDQGLQKQTVMSLLYVQMALDLEAADYELFLPDQFLETWWGGNQQQQSDNDYNNIVDDASLMELSTSRLQTSVGRAFERIEFDHVQEHVLGSGNGNGDEKCSSTALDFLSIDIANLDERIGIEVDGPAHFINVLDNYLQESSSTKSDVDTETNDDSRDKMPVILPRKPRKTGKLQNISDGKMWKFEYSARRQVNGPTALKHRLLCHTGWCVIHLPFWEWNTLGNDESNEDTYCRELLEEVIE